MNLRDQFLSHGIASPIDCLSAQATIAVRQVIDNVVKSCEGSRLCILQHPDGKQAAQAILGNPKRLDQVGQLVNWPNTQLCDFGISVRLPYNRRHSIWHRDGATTKYGGHLVCLIVSLATAGSRDSGLFFLGEFCCLTDLKSLRMPYHQHTILDDANQPRKIIRCPLEPGQALLFDCNIAHGNLMNYAPSMRVALVGFYTPYNSTQK